MSELWTEHEHTYLARTYHQLTPAQQAAELGRAPQGVYRKLRKLRRAGVILHGRTKVPWTDEDIATAVRMVRDGKSAAQIGRLLGRSANAVLNYLIAQGVTPRREIMDAGGMGATELADGLGVNRSAIVEWIQRGLLGASRRRVARQMVYSIAYEAVLSFLAEHGGYLPLTPSARWVEPVRAARAAFQARYVTRAEIARLLCVTVNFIGRRDRAGTFPPGRFLLRTHYYERASVRAWLATHPEWLTTAARVEFGL